MPFEPGGRADKLGNRHEGRWVAKQLLRLVKEDIRYVTIESVGDDEKGVDLWIGLNNWQSQAQQCKARNTSKEYWNINDLRDREILANMRFQLDRNLSADFVFVSGVPVKMLGDICDSARNSSGDSEEFYLKQIKGVGHERNLAYQQFCRALKLDPKEQDSRAIAFDYLLRIRVELYPDDDNSWNDLLTMAGFLLTGQPETTVATLLTYAESHERLGNPINPDELRRYLESQNIHLKELAYDSRISPAIKRLQEEFDESICPYLINQDVINRSETDECLNALKTNGLVIIHGMAGVGKSGVLFESTRKLQDRNMIWLPIRLDRRIPKNTAAEFGESIGLPDSPVHSLSALAGTRHCVLILDQLDAIRWTSMHSANALDVCKEMVRQVSSFRRDNRNISIVISCRTFDLENDPEIRYWLGPRKIRSGRE